MALKNEEKIKDTEALLDHLVSILESNSSRFSFECGTGGEAIKLVIYDKKKDISYKVDIEQIEYDEEGYPINL